jgi:hypothetical protein
MSKKSLSTTDDIVAHLLEPRVLELLGKALGPFIAASLEETLIKRLDGLSTAVKDLRTSNDVLVKRQAAMDKEMDELRARVNDNAARVEDTEIYSRAHDLIIRGLPETSYASRAHGATVPKELLSSSVSPSAEGSEALDQNIIDLCGHHLGVKVDPRDISIAHRLRASDRESCRPVLVRFTSRRIRDAVYRSKKSLKSLPKDASIFISEHLTKNASNVFFEARKLVKEKSLAGAWTTHGLVNVKFTSEPSEKPTIIRTSQELSAGVMRSRR